MSTDVNVCVYVRIGMEREERGNRGGNRGRRRSGGEWKYYTEFSGVKNRTWKTEM